MVKEDCYKDANGEWKMKKIKRYLNRECSDEITIVDCPVDKIPVPNCVRYDFLRGNCYKNADGTWKRDVTKDYFNPDCPDEKTVEDCPVQIARSLACVNPTITSDCFKNAEGVWKMNETKNE